MKTFTISTMLLLSQLAWSQTKVSVSDGNWNNPQTWNPPIVPIFNEDSVIVNHAVTTSNSMEVGINYLIIGVNGSLDVTGLLALHGNMKVDGEFYSDSLVIGDGDYFINTGIVEGHYFVPSNPINENYGQISLSGDLILSESLFNAASGSITSFQLITGDGNLENNGIIIADSWLHDSSADGSGSICIENCVQITGTVGGTLDICDATPNSGLPCDYNFGTVSPSVTFCANGSCAGTSGVPSLLTDFAVTIFPNPSLDGRINIETDLTIDEVLIADLTGRTVFKQATGDFSSIDLSLLENGEYLILIETSKEVIAKRLVIAH